jgi:hypothetical protein
VAGYVIDMDEVEIEGPAQRVEDHLAHIRLLAAFERPAQFQFYLDILVVRMDHLVLAQRDDLVEMQGGDIGKNLLAGFQTQNVSHPPQDGADDWQAPATIARLTKDGKVADLVTDKGHCEVVQIGDQNTTGLADRTRRAVVDDLQQHVF